MTLKEFFRQARRGRTWDVRTTSRLVRCASGLCPLAALSGYWEPKRAATKLGIGPRTAQRIAHAADSQYSKHRRWLLKNLGIVVNNPGSVTVDPVNGWLTSAGGPTASPRYLVFDDTYNAGNTASGAFYYDQVAVSTQRIGP